jgi:EamA domain-containing membrane protein RarD
MINFNWAKFAKNMIAYGILGFALGYLIKPLGNIMKRL